MYSHCLEKLYVVKKDGFKLNFSQLTRNQTSKNCKQYVHQESEGISMLLLKSISWE